ncbi:GntR family transcriptional regulator [Rhizobium sp. BK068]|uniref:GntR family transcriptional regulator n=1 Tax=Rhizobium sp. BK068 TaxID=2512130 RepID=UPI00104FAEF3|nr:GntR family transcriptional regulator [Rhizobium sp. BK068]TCM74944.1 DNA-binding GntR family transcriptional regulator [Rhizobium sp. BK068]
MWQSRDLPTSTAKKKTVRRSGIRSLWTQREAVLNGWLSIAIYDGPGYDSLTIDLRHGVIELSGGGGIAAGDVSVAWNWIGRWNPVITAFRERTEHMMSELAVDALEPLRLRPTSEIIADKIRERILSGAFAAGERVAEGPLSERLGVSRGPIREALQRLVQEGLLVNVQNKGVCVVDLHKDDLVDIYVARRAIEREAFLRVFERKDAKLIATLRHIVKEMEAGLAVDNRRIFVELDINFHFAIVDSASSPRLSRIYSTLAAEFRLCVMKAMSLYSSTEGLAEHHTRLIDLLDRGPLPELMEEFDAHLSRGIARLSTLPAE